MDAADIKPWRHISEINAFAATPEVTREQLEVMRRIGGGDRVVVAIGGKKFEFERSGTEVPSRMVDQLMHGGLPVRPEYPLLAADRHAGRLTVHGQYALAHCI
jgi:hypothetical protein